MQGEQLEQKSCLCLPVDSAKQNTLPEESLQQPEVANKLQLLFTNTTVHLRQRASTGHKFHKYSLFCFLLQHSQQAEIIHHNCSYKSLTPFLK